MDIQTDNNEPQKQEETFVFSSLSNDILEHKDMKPKLVQWGLDKTFKIHKFRYNLKFDNMNPKNFLNDLLNSKPIQDQIKYDCCFKSDVIQQFQYHKLKCNSTDLTYFDKFEESGLIMHGRIKQTYQDFIKGVEINDLIRESMMMEESEHYEVYSEQEKQELMYKLFQILIIGGGCCQNDFEIECYYNILKNIYKQIVTIKKDIDTQEFFLDSHAYQISSVENWYPKDQHDPHPQEILYVVVNPSMKIVYVITNRFEGFW